MHRLFDLGWVSLGDLAWGEYVLPTMAEGVGEAGGRGEGTYWSVIVEPVTLVVSATFH